MRTLFLRPMRCSDCKERFWVRNPSAYLAAGATLAISGLFIGAVWLIILANMSDGYVATETGSEQPAVSEAARSYRDPLLYPDAKNADKGRSSDTANIAPEARPTISNAQKLADDHYLRVQSYQESAEKGDSDAQYKLGLLYLTGNGALQDFAEAAKWLKLAAEQGYALAQYELGLIYRTGHGLAIDPIQSYMWLNLAAAAGIQQAVMIRDEVMRSLSAKQLAQAQKISREWLASRPKPKPQAPETTRMEGNDVPAANPIVEPNTAAVGKIE
ncbi:Sel1 repeat-containing protein [Nitrosospira sp. NpAV]|nr:Sel1 repeat-containing protein [Nitrosospira sp. NpAV]